MGEKRSTQYWIDAWGSEWPYLKKLGEAICDPEEKRAFWENVKSLKEKDPSFSIYTLFPPLKKKDFGLRVCEEVIAMTRRVKPGMKEEEITPEQQEISDLIDLGGHINEVCLWPKRRQAK